MSRWGYFSVYIISSLMLSGCNILMPYFSTNFSIYNEDKLENFAPA
ncbi:hypothetical protein [Candidatus Aquarickettsia rohweri]|nr:hypothetical protein [Candidatus Aquarickettsia rohweri]